MSPKGTRIRCWLVVFFTAAAILPTAGRAQESAEGDHTTGLVSPLAPQEVRVAKAGRRSKATFGGGEAVRRRIGNPIDKGFDFAGKWVYRPLKVGVNAFGQGVDRFVGVFQSLSQKTYDGIRSVLPYPKREESDQSHET